MLFYLHAAAVMLCISKRLLEQRTGDVERFSPGRPAFETVRVMHAVCCRMCGTLVQCRFPIRWTLRAVNSCRVNVDIVPSCVDWVTFVWRPIGRPHTNSVACRTSHFIHCVSCASKSNIVAIQRSQYKILGATANASRYVTNHTLHTDFNILYVSDVIHERINKHHIKLEVRLNPLLQPLLQPVNNRRLERCWPLDLQGTWGDIAGWTPYHDIVDCVWNVMAHAQKPVFVFRRNGWVHLNRRGSQFSQLLVAEVCAWAVVMLYTPCSEVVRRVLTAHSILQFPLRFPSRASPCAITFQLDCNTSLH